MKKSENIKTQYKPLVSIIVITYNSSKYVLETLISAKAQTYQNIELIVSDDCSTDNTAEICKQWIKKNKNRFSKTEMITAKKNDGISQNCNRGINAAKGEWIKLIAGDDSLKYNAIQNYINFINESEVEILALHSEVDLYNDIFDKRYFIKSSDHSKSLFSDNRLTPNQQYYLILRDQSHISAPSTFYNKKILDKIGGMDEEMPFEDIPLYYTLLKNNIKINYLPLVTANYRQHSSSVYNNKYKIDYIFNPFYKKQRIVYNKYIRRNITLIERCFEDCEFFRKNLYLTLGLNKRSQINFVLNAPFNGFSKIFRKMAIKRINKSIQKQFNSKAK